MSTKPTHVSTAAIEQFLRERYGDAVGGPTEGAFSKWFTLKVGDDRYAAVYFHHEDHIGVRHQRGPESEEHAEYRRFDPAALDFFDQLIAEIERDVPADEWSVVDDEMPAYVVALAEETERTCQAAMAILGSIKNKRKQDFAMRLFQRLCAALVECPTAVYVLHSGFEECEEANDE
jgi:hypothetical protein